MLLNGIYQNFFGVIIMDKIDKDDATSSWEDILSALLPNDVSLRILDAGTGFLSYPLSKMGHKIEYRNSHLEKTDFEEESIDVIICNGVLSHLQNAKQIWTEFKRLLKKNGQIIIFDTGDINASHIQALGFTHCRLRNFKHTNCLSARKAAKLESKSIPQTALFAKHIQTAKKQIQLYQNWCNDIGMPYLEFLVISLISKHSKGVRPSDISEALVIPPQTLTRILSNLDQSAYIERKTNNRDRRSSVITLTESGATKINALQANLRTIEEKAFSNFNIEELSNLNTLSNKLLLALESVF